MNLQAKKLLTAVLLAGMGLSSVPVLAQDTGFYLGGSIGQSQFDVDTGQLSALGATGISTDDSDSGWKIFGGYQFNKTWGLEVGYVDFGKVGIKGTAGGPFTVNLDLTAFTVAGTGTVPLANAFSAFGKAGLYIWDSKASSSGTIVATGNDGTDLMLGAGVLYNLSKNVAIQGEIEYFAGDDTVTLFSIGLRFKF